MKVPDLPVPKTMKNNESDRRVEIVIVDDDAFILEIIRAEFERDSNVHLACFLTGTECLKYLESTTPSAIIVDLGLPDMDGMEVLSELVRRNISPGIPVVVLSGTDDIASRKEAIQEGASAFVEKPFFPQKLRQLVLKLAGSDDTVVPAN